jgi:hypothetical protein
MAEVNLQQVSLQVELFNKSRTLLKVKVYIPPPKSRPDTKIWVLKFVVYLLKIFYGSTPLSKIQVKGNQETA